MKNPYHDVITSHDMTASLEAVLQRKYTYQKTDKARAEAHQRAVIPAAQERKRYAGFTKNMVFCFIVRKREQD